MFRLLRWCGLISVLPVLMMPGAEAADRDSFAMFPVYGSEIEGLSGITTSSAINAVLSDDGTIYSLVGLLGDNVEFENNEAIVQVKPGGPVELIVRKGQVVSGKRIRQINNSGANPIVTDGAGNILFEAYVYGGPVGRLVLIHGNRARLRIIAGDGMAAPGRNGTLASFLHYRMNRSGVIAFHGGTTQPRAILFSGGPRSLRAVIKSGVHYRDMILGEADDPSVKIATLGRVFLNDEGTILLEADLTPRESDPEAEPPVLAIDYTNDKQVLLVKDGKPVPIMRTGMEAPGLSGYRIGTVLLPESFANGDQALIEASVALEGSGGDPGRAYYVRDGQGLHFLTRTGWVIPGSGGATVSYLVGGAICDTGRVVMVVGLGDGRTGIWTWSSGEEPEVLALEGDGAPDYLPASILDRPYGATISPSGRVVANLDLVGGSPGIWAEESPGVLKAVSVPGATVKHPATGDPTNVYFTQFPLFFLGTIGGGSDGQSQLINKDGDLIFLAGLQGGNAIAMNLDPSVRVDMYRLTQEAVENLDEGKSNVDAPLEPVGDPGILSRQPTVDGGLVADGVTPLLFSVEPSLLDRNRSATYRIALSVEDGGTLDQGLQAQFLRNGTWSMSGNTLSVDPDEPLAFFGVRPIASDGVKFENGENELTCLATVRDAASNEVLQEFEFAVRKPPVTLIHGYNTPGFWGENIHQQLGLTRPLAGAPEAPNPVESFVITVRYGQERAEDPAAPIRFLYAEGSELATAILGNTVLPFPQLAAMLEGKVDEALDPLRSRWAFTRHDVVAHSQGGILARMLASEAGPGIRPFQSEQDFFRGRFHRIITIGSPHNGSRLVRYLMALSDANAGRDTDLLSIDLNELLSNLGEDIWNHPQGYAAQAFTGLGVARDKFDPIGPQIQELNKPGGPWMPDPDARFHLVRTSINQRQPPNSSGYTYGDWIAGLADDVRGAKVLPFGSDGVVDFRSMGGQGPKHPPVTDDPKPDNVYDLPASAEISHSGPAKLFDATYLGLPVRQVGSMVVAYHVRVALDQTIGNDVYESHVIFGKFPLPTRHTAETVKEINEAAKSLVIRSGEGITAEPNTGGVDGSSNSKAFAPANSAYDLTANPLPDLPFGREVQWRLQVYGPDGITEEGASLTPSGSQSQFALLEIDEELVGDLVVYAQYYAEDGTLVVLRPKLVESIEPTGKTLVAIKVYPETVEVGKGTRILPEIETIYDDDSSFFRFTGAGVTAVSDRPEVVDVEDPARWETEAIGETTVTVTYRLLSDTSSITVVPTSRTSHLPSRKAGALDEEPESWTGNEGIADGVYSGLVTLLGGDAVGVANLRINRGGGLSGIVTAEEFRLPFRGPVADDGTFQATLSHRPTGREFNLLLQLVATPEGFRFSGNLGDAEEIYFITSEHADFDPRRDPAPWAGTYTALVPANPLYSDGSAHPQGDGWATISVAGNGRIRLVGQLGDTERLTLAGSVSRDGTWPVYRELYRGRPRGRLGGTITFRQVPNTSDFDGALHWMKPANPRDRFYPRGFDLEVTMVGAGYGMPSGETRLLTSLVDSMENVSWSLGGGNLPSGDVSGILTWDTRNRLRYTPAASERLVARVIGRTGAFAGSYREPSAGFRLNFRGVVFQKQGIVAGTFPGNAESGYVLLRPIGEPRIEVSAYDGGALIENFDASPESGDGTDLGDAGVDFPGYAQRSFRIANRGGADLFLIEIPRADGEGFSVAAGRAGLLRPGEETVFTVRFDPTSLGESLGEVRLFSNDEDSNPFRFAIRANGVPGSVVNDITASGGWEGVLPAAPEAAPEWVDLNESDPAHAALYRGLIREAGGGGVAGVAVVAVRNNGSYSGLIDWRGGRYRARGSFEGGASAIVLSAVRWPGLGLALQMVRVPESGSFAIRGSLSGEGESLDLLLERSDYHGRNNPAGEAGAYTMVLPGNEELGSGLPAGDGALTATVLSNGRIRSLGVLGDGERFASTGSLTNEGGWAIFQKLYRGRPRGFLAGQIWFRDVDSVSDLDGELEWLRPGDAREPRFAHGFRLRIPVVGSLYAVPDPGAFPLDTLVDGKPNAFLILDDYQGGSNPGAYPFTWLANGATRFPAGANGELTQLRIQNRTGFLQGAMRDSGGSVRSIAAVVFQKQNRVSGNFTGGESTGRVVVRTD